MAGIARQGYTKSKGGQMSRGLNPRVAEPRLRIIRKLFTFIVLTCIQETIYFLIGKSNLFGG